MLYIISTMRNKGETKMTETKERPEVKAGDFVNPDGWGKWNGEILQEDDGFKDSSFPGCQFRLPSNTCPDCKFAVNVRITGKERWDKGSGWFRCEVEFVGDGEPSTFTRGWLHKNVW